MNNKAKLKPKVKTLFRKTIKAMNRNSNPEVLCKKNCFEAFCTIYWKKLVPESPFYTKLLKNKN